MLGLKEEVSVTLTAFWWHQVPARTSRPRKAACPFRGAGDAGSLYTEPPPSHSTDRLLFFLEFPLLILSVPLLGQVRDRRFLRHLVPRCSFLRGPSGCAVFAGL